MAKERGPGILFAGILLFVVVLAVTAAMAGIGYHWVTTGPEWFTLAGYEFHKHSFAFGLVVGAIVLGGGGCSTSA